MTAMLLSPYTVYFLYRCRRHRKKTILFGGKNLTLLQHMASFWWLSFLDMLQVGLAVDDIQQE